MLKSIDMESVNELVKEKIKLSCNVLKSLACIFMFIDHFGYGILHNYMIAHAMSITPDRYKTLNSIYEACRGVGRLAFPIFCFFLVEGFIRTRNVSKYALRLLILALVTEIPFDLGLYGTTVYTDHQNIIITFLIALAMLCVIKYINETFTGLSGWVMALCRICTVIAFSDAAFLIKSDYSWKCMLLTFVLYWLRSTGALRLVAGAAVVSWKAYAPISFVLLYFYDPSVRPRFKYFFYLFYPLHLLVIYLIARIVI